MMPSPRSGGVNFVGEGFASNISPLSDSQGVRHSSGGRHPGEPHIDEASSADNEIMDAIHGEQQSDSH